MKLKNKRKMKVKTKKLISSFKYAFQGLYSSFKTERNMKIHILIMIIVIIFGIILKINYKEWIICTILFAIVLSGELFNTAIERVVDIVMPYRDKKAKLAKDISASAVLVLAIGASIVGLIIFIPKIVNLM